MKSRFYSMFMVGSMAFFYFHNASAWQEVRNGGDALICVTYDPTGFQFANTVYMLDYFEMVSRYRLKLAPPEWDVYYPPAKTAQEFAGRIPAQMSEIRSSAMALAGSFYQEAQFQKAKLFDVKDAGQGYIPSDCQLEQLVLQAPPLGPEDSYYIVNQLIWEQMNSMQQVTAILHEVIYRLAPDERKQFSSEKIRYIVALIVSDTLKDKTPEELQRLFSGIGF